MNQLFFVNLPVKDLKRSMKFYSDLGYKFNPQFTNDDAACMVISDNLFAMLITEKEYKTFTKKELGDSHKQSSKINTLSAESRMKVDAMIEKAIRAGGKIAGTEIDEDFMYVRAFEDPDGHEWEILYMDMEKAPKTPRKPTKK